MAYPIHPAAQTRAAKHGARIVAALPTGFRIEDLATGRLSVVTFDKVAECGEALEDKRNPIEWEKPRAANAHLRSGVMVKSYHDVYSKNPDGPGCGDRLDIAMRAACVYADPDTTTAYCHTEDLKVIGIENGLWNPSWMSLNPGMIRMNLTNRLRAALRRDASTVITIDGETGRFDVAVKTPKDKKKGKKEVVKVEQAA